LTESKGRRLKSQFCFEIAVEKLQASQNSPKVWGYFCMFCCEFSRLEDKNADFSGPKYGKTAPLDLRGAVSGSIF
jgi:hypothetical protein